MFCENYIIKGILHCDSGLHIGNPSDEFDMGASDNPVVKDPLTNFPYIPGSSIKGKLRFLTELNDDSSRDSVKENDGMPSNNLECIASQIFGIPLDENVSDYPTRIIVRDSYPTEETISLWENSDGIYNGVELKYENTIDRISANAILRNIERIPRGSEFNIEIIFSIYEGDNENNLLYFLESLKYLEDTYLGGSGSRGYGKIRFKNFEITKKDKEYYTTGIINKKNTLKFDDTTSLLKCFRQFLKWYYVDLY